MRAILRFGVKLTRQPDEVSDEDVTALRSHDLSDRDIHRVVQVVAYFNYINRIADGLGVDLEPEMPPATS